MTGLRIGPSYIVGHSLGGAVAIASGQDNEDIISCSQDCHINIETLLSGENFRQTWFLRILFFGIIGSTAYLIISRPKWFVSKKEKQK